MISLDSKLNLSVLKDLSLNEFVGWKENKQTHKSLSVLGANWLIRVHKCRAVLVERGGSSKEMPDVLGFYGSDSYMIEAKASRADFLADSNKTFRVCPAMGVGRFRYYICPANLISVEELPENWGLLYVSEKGRIRKIKDAEPFPYFARDQEFMILVSALSSPWKLFQHWTESALERLWKINWMSKNMDFDTKQFAARIAANRLEESE